MELAHYTAAEAPPPPRPKRRRGCWVALALFGVGLLGLGCAVVLAVSTLLSRLPSGTPIFPGDADSGIRREVVDHVGFGDAEIVVVDVKGVILGQAPFDAASARTIVGHLAAARRDDDVVAVVLDMNTPGGEVTASDEIHRAVQEVRDAGKPVVTCMRALGASGGYLVAAGTDYIIANRLTLTGSIGVIAGTLNYSLLFKNIGLESEVYASGELKSFLHGGKTRTDAERALITEIVSANVEAFARIVAHGRSRFETWEDVLAAEFGDGRVLTGTQALAHGLIDEEGYFDDALDKARELAGSPSARAVRYRRSLRLTDLLLSMQASKALGLRSVLPREMQFVQPGRFYYLLPGVMP